MWDVTFVVSTKTLIGRLDIRRYPPRPNANRYASLIPVVHDEQWGFHDPSERLMTVKQADVVYLMDNGKTFAAWRNEDSPGYRGEYSSRPVAATVSHQ